MAPIMVYGFSLAGFGRGPCAVDETPAATYTMARINMMAKMARYWRILSPIDEE
jgi:hypothetical protein